MIRNQTKRHTHTQDKILELWLVVGYNPGVEIVSIKSTSAFRDPPRTRSRAECRTNRLYAAQRHMSCVIQ